mmetsp:Transcript_47777/g.152432  ORF Transcript_47777/g.152432 Transcript_47777/m.152432 type:complete len:211 (-) Transcript_47777:386-1018(-)
MARGSHSTDGSLTAPSPSAHGSAPSHPTLSPGAPLGTAAAPALPRSTVMPVGGSAPGALPSSCSASAEHGASASGSSPPASSPASGAAAGSVTPSSSSGGGTSPGGSGPPSPPAACCFASRPEASRAAISASTLRFHSSSTREASWKAASSPVASSRSRISTNLPWRTHATGFASPREQPAKTVLPASQAVRQASGGAAASPASSPSWSV